MCHHRAVFSLGLLFVTAGATMFLMFTWMYIPPYIYSKDFKETTCKVHSSYLSGNVCCSLDTTGQCKYSYGCWEVVVNYTKPEIVQANMFKDYETATQQQNQTCSVYAGCVEYSYGIVSAQLPSFTSSYGQVNQEYSCFYNPVKATEVLLWRVDFQSVLHSCLWSFIILIAGIIITVLASKQIGNCYREYEDDEEKLKEETKDQEASPASESTSEDKLRTPAQALAVTYSQHVQDEEPKVKPRTPLSPSSSTPLFLEDGSVSSDPRGGLSSGEKMSDSTTA